jgi:hypothetical protein
MNKKGIYQCPMFDVTCPYCKKGNCYMQVETGESPLDGCDEYQAWDDDDDEEEDE